MCYSSNDKLLKEIKAAMDAEPGHDVSFPTLKEQLIKRDFYYRELYEAIRNAEEVPLIDTRKVNENTHTIDDADSLRFENWKLVPDGTGFILRADNIGFGGTRVVDCFIQSFKDIDAAIDYLNSHGLEIEIEIAEKENAVSAEQPAPSIPNNDSIGSKSIDKLMVGNVIEYGGETWRITDIDGDFMLCLENLGKYNNLAAESIVGNWKDTIEEMDEGEIEEISIPDGVKPFTYYIENNRLYFADNRTAKPYSGDANSERAIKLMVEIVQRYDHIIADISFRLGSFFIPSEMFTQFMYDTFETNMWARNSALPRGVISCEYIAATNEWRIPNKTAEHSVKVDEEFGTKRLNAYELMELVLNQRKAEVKDKVTYRDEDGEHEKYVLNRKETILARDKQAKIEQAFREWILADPTRIKTIEEIYNNSYFQRYLRNVRVAVPPAIPHAARTRH